MPNSRREVKDQKEQCQLQAETYEENNVSKTEFAPMTRNKDTESHRRMASEQELKVAEKAGEHQVKIGTKIEIEKQKAAELRNPGTECQEIARGAATQNGRCMEGRDTETTNGEAHSYRSLKKRGRVQGRIPKNGKT